MSDPLEDSINDAAPDKWVQISVKNGIVDMSASGMTAFEVYELLVQGIAVTQQHPEGGDLTGLGVEDVLGPLGAALGFHDPE